MNDLACPDCGSNIYMPSDTCGTFSIIIISCTGCDNAWNRFGLNLTREYGVKNDFE